MSASLRPLLGCTALALSVNRSYWVMNAVQRLRACR